MQYIIANDCTDGGKIAIGKKGVLLSVLGNSLVASSVTPELDAAVRTAIGTKKPFFEFLASDLVKNHLSISYQEQSNTVYVIGISDLVIGLADPIDIGPDKLRAKAVRLKSKPENGLASKHVVLIRPESELAKPTKLVFYLLEVV